MFLLAAINHIFLLYWLMIVVRILVTWVPEWRNSTFVIFLAYFTDPYLNLFRRVIPPLGMLDLSPLIALFFLGIVQNVLEWLVIAFLVK